jgi:hypothetical protein
MFEDITTSGLVAALRAVESSDPYGSTRVPAQPEERPILASPMSMQTQQGFCTFVPGTIIVRWTLPQSGAVRAREE